MLAEVRLVGQSGLIVLATSKIAALDGSALLEGADRGFAENPVLGFVWDGKSSTI